MSVFGAFLVRIFSPLFSPNEGKYGLEKLQIRTLFLFLFFQNKFDVDLVYIVVTYLALQWLKYNQYTNLWEEITQIQNKTKKI